MKAINGSIKSYPITLMKEAVVFIEGDTNESWIRYKNVPLIYLGTHTTGQMMFETPNEGTIYLNCPTIGCIIPPEYKEHVWDLEEDFLESLDDDSESESKLNDFEAHRAKDDEKSTNIPAILRAAALSVENNEFGEVDRALVIVGTSDTLEYVYRPVGMTKEQILYCLEYCKLSTLEVARFPDLDVFSDE